MNRNEPLQNFDNLGDIDLKKEIDFYYNYGWEEEEKNTFIDTKKEDNKINVKLNLIDKIINCHHIIKEVEPQKF